MCACAPFLFLDRRYRTSRDDPERSPVPGPGRADVEPKSKELSSTEVPLNRRAPGRNPNPLRGFSQDLLNLGGPPQNPPWAGFERDLSN